MFYRLFLLIRLNIWDLKNYLRLDLAPGSQVILQCVMIYNLIVWSIFLYQTRERFQTYLTGSPTRHLDFSKEFRAVLGNYNRFDHEYLTQRYYYRLYLGFMVILILTTILFFMPQTWQLAFGNYLYHLFASIFSPPAQAAS
jgi:hypothetical protein